MTLGKHSTQRVLVVAGDSHVVTEQSKSASAYQRYVSVVLVVHQVAEHAVGLLLNLRQTLSHQVDTAAAAVAAVVALAMNLLMTCLAHLLMQDMHIFAVVMASVPAMLMAAGCLAVEAAMHHWCMKVVAVILMVLVATESPQQLIIQQWTRANTHRATK